MPVVSELPWYLTGALPWAYIIPPLAPLGLPLFTLQAGSAVISYTVLRHKKKHSKQLPNLLSTPSQTSRPGEKPPSAANVGKWYRFGHWLKGKWKDVKHYWKMIWGNEKEGVEWMKDLQYPRPGDVMFYPLRPDLNPYLDPKDAAQPQVSDDQLARFELQAKEMYKYAGKGKTLGHVPRSERIKYDSWKRKDRCSGQNLIWHYLSVGDGSVPDGLDSCPGYVRLLMDRGCAITVGVSSCDHSGFGRTARMLICLKGNGLFGFPSY